MQENNPINQEDIFEKTVKSKLENYPMPLDESVWQGIEQRLAPRRRRAVPLWWYALGGGVAASLALLLWLNPFRQSVDDSLVVQKSNPEFTLEHPHEKSAVKKEKKFADMNKREKIIYIHQKNSSIKPLENKRNLVATQTPAISEENQKPSTYSASDKTASTAFQSNEVRKGVANSDLQKRDSIPAKKTEPQLTSLPEIPELLEDVKDDKPSKKKNNNWLLAANVSSNGALDLNPKKNSIYTDAPTMREALGSDMSKFASSTGVNVLAPSGFTDIQYLPPLSFGITLQKSLTPHWSVSSGLVYTYLRSNYSTSAQFNQAKATLDLHYLGIPLNVNYLIKETSYWNFYVSAGGMIEKGLRSIYKQTIINNPNNPVTQQTDLYSKIEGVQTSFNGAFGVGYKFDRRFSLYFEPKITYYFKNNQPMSARTQTPLNVGFTGGLKIGL